MNDPKEKNEEVRESETVCVIELTRGWTVIVSEIDYDLKEFNWCWSGRYAMRNERRKGILMHRVIAERMGLNMAMQIGHKDGNRLNNRRENLYDIGKPVPRRRRPKGGPEHGTA
jgi:hypothetical protein